MGNIDSDCARLFTQIGKVLFPFFIDRFRIIQKLFIQLLDVWRIRTKQIREIEFFRPSWRELFSLKYKQRVESRVLRTEFRPSEMTLYSTLFQIKLPAINLINYDQPH